MTTNQLIDAWRAWLQANHDENPMRVLDRLSRIAVEMRRPSVERQRRKMFRRRRG